MSNTILAHAKIQHIHVLVELEIEVFDCGGAKARSFYMYSNA